MELEEAIERLKRGIEDTMFSTLYSQEQEEEDIKTVLNHLTKQEKMIELMVDEILILDIKRANYVKDKPRIWETEKGIKQYFEKKAEEG